MKGKPSQVLFMIYLIIYLENEYSDANKRNKAEVPYAIPIPYVHQHRKSSKTHLQNHSA